MVYPRRVTWSFASWIDRRPHIFHDFSLHRGESSEPHLTIGTAPGSYENLSSEMHSSSLCGRASALRLVLHAFVTITGGCGPSSPLLGACEEIHTCRTRV